MLRRYREMLVATWLVILPFTPAIAKDKHPHPAASAAPAPDDPGSLYSPRALRRAKLLIELELLTLRKERLACARRAVANHAAPPQVWQCFRYEVAPAVKRESPAHERKHRQAQWTRDGR